MNKYYSFFMTLMVSAIAFSCAPNKPLINRMEALQQAITDSNPGDEIVLEDGDFEGDVELNTKGMKDSPIVISARNKHKALIKNTLTIKGDYIHLKGLRFAGEGALIIEGTGCRLTESYINDSQSKKWVRVLAGSKMIEIDHNVFENKTSNSKGKNSQLMQIIVLNQNEQHHIHHNIFKDIPEGGGNGFETLQLITKGNPWDPAPGKANMIIEDNLFVRCNGEAEIISVKSNGNMIRGNTFRSSKGGLVLRHGDDNVVNQNYFFGNNVKGSGGVRLQGNGHIVTNNYFQALDNYAIGMMDGTPDSLYMPVENIRIAFNSFINCSKMAVIGMNHSKHPNGTTPRDCIFAGNLYHSDEDNGALTIAGFVQGDVPIDFTWEGNVSSFKDANDFDYGVISSNTALEPNSNNMHLPTAETPKVSTASYQSEVFENDLTGAKRESETTVGAIQYPVDTETLSPLTIEKLNLLPN
ncbi:MAG: polysaccharide lyase 6 family protein [Cyclobacteriaceae bacterium]